MENPRNPLYEQHCAFTGRLQKYTRKVAMQNIEVIPEVVFYHMLASSGYGQICMDEWLLRHESA